MARPLTTYEKVKRSFDAIGVEITESSNLYEFEYNRTHYLLDIDDEFNVFTISRFVLPPSGKELSKQTFDMALEVMNQHYEFVEGLWCDKCPPILSTMPCNMKPMRQVPKTYLKKLIENFINAHTFLQMNIYMMLDETVLDEI